MNTLCKFCEKPIRHGLVMFGESPLHPSCHDELQREMNSYIDQTPESVLDISWGGHPTEQVLQEQIRDCPF